jgi:hypothetical protein
MRLLFAKILAGLSSCLIFLLAVIFALLQNR